LEVHAVSPTLSRIIVSDIPALSEHPEGMRQLKDGLAKAVACLDVEPLCELPSEDRALPEWERAVVATAIEEIAPAVATMLSVAIERRLPWWSSIE
jgi:hypothetical protein